MASPVKSAPSTGHGGNLNVSIMIHNCHLKELLRTRGTGTAALGGVLGGHLPVYLVAGMAANLEGSPSTRAMSQRAATSPLRGESR